MAKSKSKLPKILTQKKRPTKRKGKSVSRLTRLSRWASAHKLVTALIAITLFGAVGAGYVLYSKASTGDRGAVAYMQTAEGCWLGGRVWDSGTTSCTRNCRGAGTLIAATSTHKAYCSGFISPNVDQGTCNNNLRRYVVETGCARRGDQDVTAGARQCRYSSDTYYPTTGIDYCKTPSTSGGTSTSTSGSAWSWPGATYTIGNGYQSGHWGIDIKGSVGQPVKAVASGTVTHKGTIASGCGTGLILRVKKPGSTAYVFPTYEHITLASTVGDNVVNAGEVIGYIQNVGSSWCWTGPHLHFHVQTDSGSSFHSVRGDNTYLPNPCNFLSGC
jgi:hypothetical protein